MRAGECMAYYKDIQSSALYVKAMMLIKFFLAQSPLKQGGSKTPSINFIYTHCS